MLLVLHPTTDVLWVESLQNLKDSHSVPFLVLVEKHRHAPVGCKLQEGIVWSVVKAAEEMRNRWVILEKLECFLLVGMIGFLVVSCSSSFDGNEGTQLIHCTIGASAKKTHALRMEI